VDELRGGLLSIPNTNCPVMPARGDEQSVLSVEVEAHHVVGVSREHVDVNRVSVVRIVHVDFVVHSAGRELLAVALRWQGIV